VTHLRKMMLEELQRRNYAETTINSYLRTVEEFSRRFNCSRSHSALLMRRLLCRPFLEKQIAEVGYEDNGYEPRHQQSYCHHREEGETVFTRATFGKTDREKSGDGHQCAGQHGKCGGRVRKGGGPKAIEALLELSNHHFYRDHRIVHEKTEGDDQRTE